MTIDKLDDFKKRVDKKKDGYNYTGMGDYAIERMGTDLDATINYRVNKELKEAFDRLCKLNHSTMARELKIYMTEAVRIQKLL